MIVSKKYLAIKYDGSNATEVVTTMQELATGNVFSFQYEDEERLVVRESNPWTYYDWNIFRDRWVLVMPGDYIYILTETQVLTSYVPMKALFLEAANDPDVIAALKAAIENAP